MDAFAVLPPTEKRRQFELRALALRDFAGVGLEEALDPFALAQFAKLLVVDFDQIKGLSAESREHLAPAPMIGRAGLRPALCRMVGESSS